MPSIGIGKSVVVMVEKDKGERMGYMICGQLKCHFLGQSNISAVIEMPGY